jgi:type IV pilus assembly protein PilN
MIKINLLSEGKRQVAVRKGKQPSQLLQGRDLGPWLLVVGAVLGLLVLGLWWWLLDGERKQKDVEIAAAQKRVDELAEVIKEVDDYKRNKAELERKIGVINDLKANQRGPVRIMDDVSRALPELLWLDRMTVAESSIEIEGRSFNQNAVASFMDNLDNFPELEEPNLKDLQEQTGGVHKFIIDLGYSFAPPAAAATEAGTPAAAAPPPAAAATSG